MYNSCRASDQSTKLVLDTKNWTAVVSFILHQDISSYKHHLHHPNLPPTTGDDKKIRRRRSRANRNADTPGEPLGYAPAPVGPAGHARTLGGVIEISKPLANQRETPDPCRNSRRGLDLWRTPWRYSLFHIKGIFGVTIVFYF